MNGDDDKDDIKESKMKELDLLEQNTDKFVGDCCEFCWVSAQKADLFCYTFCDNHDI